MVKIEFYIILQLTLKKEKAIRKTLKILSNSSSDNYLWLTQMSISFSAMLMELKLH